MCILRAVRREPRFLNCLAPVAPVFADPLRPANIGNLFEEAVAEGNATILRGRPPDLLDDAVLVDLSLAEITRDSWGGDVR
jgi:hypothetical protein